MSDAKVRFYDLKMDDAPAETAARFGFACPKGRGTCSGLLIAGRTDYKRDGQGKNGGRPMWDFDGNAAAPTFQPSINCKIAGTECWHGHIRNGRCVSTSGADEPEPPSR